MSEKASSHSDSTSPQSFDQSADQLLDQQLEKQTDQQMNQPVDQQTDPRLNISGSTLKGVQIGGIAGGDLAVTQIQGGVGALNVFGSVQIASDVVTQPVPLSQKEYRMRQVLVAKVKQYWIDGVLNRSLYTQVLLDLSLSEAPQTQPQTPWVQSPTAVFEEFSAPAQALPLGIEAADIFDDMGAGRTLLILGEPGAGKTVTLLKLANSLLARVENDLSQPLPVVINLSAWAIARLPMEDWLASALSETYGASASLFQAWIAQEQLILLLDGLDEVEARYRNDCVQALNRFIQSHGLTEMVVCSRIKDRKSVV